MGTPKNRSIEPVVTRRALVDHDQDREDMLYWLSRPAEERFAAVEDLRREYYGQNYATQPGLPRSAWPIKRRSL